MIRAALLCCLAIPAWAAPLRVASYDPGLSRNGPGLLLRDLQKGGDAQAEAAIAVIAAARADVIVLTGFDWDYEGRALEALRDQLRAAGAPYPHAFAPQPNSGVPSGLDLDGDGRLGSPRDAQGYGGFTGQNGLAVLSRYPFGAARDFSDFLWRDLPGNQQDDPPGVAAVQRLSSTAHWDLEVITPGGPLHLWTYRATPPVFDGPEDRNGRRNHDETAFWLRYLEGALPQKPADAPFVLLGMPNLDPVDGEGRRDALAALLADPRLEDPAPTSPGAARAPQTGANARQSGDPARDTVLWPAEGEGNAPGNLRVDLILPDARLDLRDAGVLWPAPEDPMAGTVAAASAHRLVWVDLDLP